MNTSKKIKYVYESKQNVERTDLSTGILRIRPLVVMLMITNQVIVISLCTFTIY